MDRNEVLETAIEAAVRLLDGAPVTGQQVTVDGEVERIMEAFPTIDRVCLKKSILKRLQEINHTSPHVNDVWWQMLGKGEDS